MKKLISLTLAAMMTSAALAGCASIKPGLDPQIRITSSDAESAAQWLDQRLDTIPDRIVIGTDSAKYGIDVSALEDDGYIIRNLGGEVAIFARTEDGLDRAVRKYAKSVDAGDIVADETYHEGYRIKRLTIAGNDISEYSVAVEGEWEYLRNWVGTEVVCTFTELVREACGVTLPVGEVSPRRIIFREVPGEYAESAYGYRVENGELIFEYSHQLGAKNAMTMFLEDECGWDFLLFGDSELAEADHIDIPEDLEKRVTPLLTAGIQPHASTNADYDNDLLRLNPTLSKYYYHVLHTSHGMTSNEWGGIVYTNWRQICYTDEAIRLNVLADIIDYVEVRLDSGMVIGEDLHSINLGQGDNLEYCHCSNCMKVLKQENNANSGAVVRWVNKIAEDMEAEGYGGLVYKIFAYHGSNQPCVTHPRDDILVTYCLDGSCCRHLLDGSQCQETSFDFAGIFGKDARFGNPDYYEWLKGWCDISNRVYVYSYALRNNYHQFSYIFPMYDDIRLIAETGAEGIFWDTNGKMLGTSSLEPEIRMRIQIRPDMTRAEYSEMVNHVLRNRFGDGWAFIREALDIWEKAELLQGGCENCWNMNVDTDFDLMDYEFYYENWDHICELFEKAYPLACSQRQEDLLRQFAFLYIHNGFYAGYFREYEAGNTERIEEMKARYAENYQMYIDAGGDFKKITGGTINPDLESTAWKIWIVDREKFFPEGTELKPVPQEFAAQG